MTSAAPLGILDEEDDDEFDWEAAVREIEVACANINPNPNPNPNSCCYSSSVSALNVPSSSHSAPSASISFPGKPKQSTLDRFVRKAVANEGPTVVVEVEGDDERVASSVGIDADAAKTWIYPVNIPLRDYQLAITKTALFSNTLVALPTGLGKTLIAAVVMYNYFRWFPEGKIVFAAPSRPLVLQQIEACHNIVGIPQEWTTDMTGQISPTRRAFLWKAKRVFFVTPQVLEKDIQAGTCVVRCLVCLVIDEAHRALGNYSYCVAVRELMEVPVQLRILALTATPGSKQQAIQHIINNLHISTLEYRNESDSDVSPYVHDRKLELIEVPLGKDAANVNQQLLEVIRPYVSRLSTLGLLPNRDYQTLSPPDLLNSREHFRRAPPPELPQSKYGEIEACFGGLITLYHIRKLLSSHGIRPAYEMLEEKLKQGAFARLMGRNDSIRKVKVLMQRSLSHGAPSPKLSKMLQVLTDHFKTKDPRSSRVIIFSNFRGSVRDIMDALADIGDIVKATEFVGQSSAKELKGQTQKVQQAVLQKFRAGGYNVIVATSIGEEGLDIMEVDLVICFDANVSPLRMIQRMGRTGRKNNGRVVVLACEGSELKGYMRKQANSRTIRKHMYNGGIHSFNFHPSPRMIPHIFKPEVQFVELSIEKYIPRGKKGKEDNVVQAFSFTEKLTCEERDLLAKYFQPPSESTWRPSLIAFPLSQAFPSRVLKVMHSSRTDMLIDSMQHLQGLSISRDGGAFSIEDEVSSDKSHGVHLFYEEDNHFLDQGFNFVQNEDNHKGGCLTLDDTSLTNEQIEATELEPSPNRTKKQCPQDHISQIPPAHSFLFNSDIVSIDALGRVHISCVPSLAFRHENSSGCTRDGKPLLVNHVGQNASSQKISDQNCKGFTEVGKYAPKPSEFEAALGSAAVLDASRSSLAHVLDVEELDQVGTTPCVPHVKKNMLNGDGCTLEILGVMEVKGPTLGDASSSKLRDGEMSPRLNNLILSGIVPESPANQNGNLCATASDGCVTPEVSTYKCDAELLPKLPDVGIRRKHGQTNISSFTNKRLRIPSPLDTVTASGQQALVSPVSVGTSSTKKSSSEDWFVNSADKSQNIEPVPQLKRLRKVGDNVKNKNPEKSEKSLLPVVNLERRFSDKTDTTLFKSEKKKNDVIDGLVELEVEVSSDHEVSSDEVCEGDSSYENSFIDDRISPTAHSTQAESSRVNMLAVYRRSLLSQSPMQRELSSGTFTPSDSSLMSRTDRSGSSSIKPLSSLHTSEVNVELQERNSGALPFTASTSMHENGSKFGIRKRKLSFVQSESTPCIDLEGPRASKSDIVDQKSECQGPTDDMDASDDQFFAGVDLDAVEEQAVLVLQRRSQTQKMGIDPKPDQQKFDQHSIPSFDLGIF